MGIKADRPFAVVDQYGTPRTEALHVVERYRLSASLGRNATLRAGSRTRWAAPAQCRYSDRLFLFGRWPDLYLWAGRLSKISSN
jgi:hypothetical protein